MRTIDMIRDTRIERVVQESSNIRSFYFKDAPSLSSKPGQFAMVWLPGVGEFPMSLSLPSKEGLASISVKPMGVGTRILYDATVGCSLGIRGPYGSAFEIQPASRKKKRVLLVGGGTGMVPIIVLSKALLHLGSIHSSMVIGARTKDELPFLNIARKMLGSRNVFPSTDDGTLGFKGYAHELIEKLVLREKFDEIFCCGPERMMVQVLRIAKENGIRIQCSLERIMKCGIAICGSCTIGDIILCRDGPVLNEKDLERVRSEFGLYRRDKTGKLCPI